MIPIILRTFRDRWKMLLAVTAIGVLTMLMYTALFPSYQKILSKDTQLFSQMPEALKKAFNLDTMSFDTLEKFLNIEMYSLFWPVLTIILVSSLSGTALAGDVERETIVQTLAQPISRSKTYIAKFLAAAKIFTVFNVVVNASVIPLAAAFHIHITASHFLTVGVMGELFGLGLVGLGFAVSSFLSDKGKVNMTFVGVILFMYVMNIVAGIEPNIDRLKFVSLFHYFDPNKFLIKGQYDLTATLVFVGLLVVGFAVGWWRWRSRDIL